MLIGWGRTDSLQWHLDVAGRQVRIESAMLGEFVRLISEFHDFGFGLKWGHPKVTLVFLKLGTRGRNMFYSKSHDVISSVRNEEIGICVCPYWMRRK